jgi:hypothetical protein
MRFHGRRTADKKKPDNKRASVFSRDKYAYRGLRVTREKAGQLRNRRWDYAASVVKSGDQGSFDVAARCSGVRRGRSRRGAITAPR